MPLFAFVCNECTCEFEELVHPDERVPCPRCGSGAVERQLSRVNVGGSTGPRAMEPPPGCGTCGDPRGPGACSLN